MNIDEELEQILDDDCNYKGKYPTELRKEIKSLIKRVIEEAMPEKKKTEMLSAHYSRENTIGKFNGFNEAIDQFNSNLERIYGNTRDN